MKQIFNWTIGSFFRSIGRIVAYLVIGGIIAYLVSGGDFRGFKISELFFDKVSAMSLDGTIVKEVRVNTATRTESNLFSNDYTLLHYFNNNTIYSGDGDVAVFVISGYTGYYQGIDPDNTGYETLNMNNILYSIKLINSSGYTWTSCELQNNRIVCPMIKGHGNYGGLEFRFHSDGEDIYFTFQINQYAILYNKDNTIIKDSIDSQTQQQHQDHQDTMNTITNTNSTQEVSDATDYFESVNDTSQDGIKAVVSMPLNIFNALTLGSTKDLCFTLKSKQTCLPSGNIIWGKTSRTQIHVGNATVTQHAFSNQDIPTGVNNFKIIFNLVVGGYLAYKMLKSLMRITTDMLSPTKDKVEVLEL